MSEASGTALHLAAGAAGPLIAWVLLRRVAGTGRAGRGGAMLGGASPGHATVVGAALLDLAPAALLWLLLLAATARPLLAGALVLALAAALGVADAAKRRVLGEPVVFSDIGLLPGVVRQPQLYLPFVGAPFVAAALSLGALAVAGIAALERPIAMLGAGPLRGVLAALACVAAGRCVLRPPAIAPITGDPATDAAELGPSAMLARYRAQASAERAARRACLAAPVPLRPASPASHLVLIQAESFCRPSRFGLTAGAAPGGGSAAALPHWDALCAEALAWGRFAAPAFGANTMRAEFAVLTGVPEAALGLDRFNPYFRLARRPPIAASLAYALREAGYATACLHPFDRRFFGRHRVMPALGFERFEDEADFAGAPRIGRYVADAAIAERVVARLRAADQRGGGGDNGGPQFLFAITMQAHGPWPGPDPVATWLGHLRDTDAMLGAIAAAAATLDRPLILAAYGDHLPALPLRPAEGGDRATDYLVWRSDRRSGVAAGDRDPVALHAAIRAAVAE